MCDSTFNATHTSSLLESKISILFLLFQIILLCVKHWVVWLCGDDNWTQGKKNIDKKNL